MVSVRYNVMYNIPLHNIIIDQLSPPEDITLAVTGPGPQFTFSWSKTVSLCETEYSILSDCGNCPTSTVANITVCVNVPVDDSVCSFSLMTRVCGSILGTKSNSLFIRLRGVFIINLGALLYNFNEYNF